MRTLLASAFCCTASASRVRFLSLSRQEAMHFIDIAANLTDGVIRTMVTAGTLRQSREALNLCITVPSLFSTVGVHPTRSGELLSDADSYCRQLLSVVEEGRGKVIAIGECGLDYDRTHFCSKEDQMPGFIAQFSLAEKTRLPMFLHDRNTKGDFLRVMTENRSRFTTGVVHSFTGTMEEMKAYVELDLFIGINGCSLKTEANLEVAKAVPLDKIMLETDCPYCEIRSSHVGSPLVKSKWPSKDKKKYSSDTLVKGRSEPCQIRQVCEVVAAAKNISEEELARAAFNNTMIVFFPEEAKNMGSSPYDLSISAVPAPEGT